jgi:hypothetical protein
MVWLILSVHDRADSVFDLPKIVVISSQSGESSKCSFLSVLISHGLY